MSNNTKALQTPSKFPVMAIRSARIEFHPEPLWGSQLLSLPRSCTYSLCCLKNNTFLFKIKPKSWGEKETCIPSEDACGATHTLSYRQPCLSVAQNRSWHRQNLTFFLDPSHPMTRDCSSDSQPGCQDHRKTLISDTLRNPLNLFLFYS